MAQDSNNDDNAEAVVLVHGVWMTGFEMALLRWRLRRRGYRCYRFHYPSLRGRPAENVRRLEEFVTRLDEPVVHLVGHSLGGRLILELLQQKRISGCGRVVCLGTPFGGSGVARWFARRRVLRWLLGRAVSVLTTPAAPWRGACDVGVIAGTRNCGLGRLVARMPPGDGTVAVAETRLDGVQCCELPVTHMGLVISATVADEVWRFLRTGEFAGQPEASAA